MKLREIETQAPLQSGNAKTRIPPYLGWLADSMFSV